MKVDFLESEEDASELQEVALEEMVLGPFVLAAVVLGDDPATGL